MEREMVLKLPLHEKYASLLPDSVYIGVRRKCCDI